jgi:hypothetical protein
MFIESCVRRVLVAGDCLSSFHAPSWRRSQAIEQSWPICFSMLRRSRRAGTADVDREAAAMTIMSQAIAEGA